MNALLRKSSLPIKATSIAVLFNMLMLSNSHAGWWREEIDSKDLEAGFNPVTLTATQNVSGKNFPVTANTNINGKKYRTNCDAGTNLPIGLKIIYTTGEYINPVVLSEDGRNFTAVNEYLIAALQYGYNANLYWLPMQNARLGLGTDTCNTATAHIGDTPFNIVMKIRKPFVGETTFRLPIARIYTGDVAGTAKLRGAFQTVYLSGKVIVPQSCKINVGQQLDIKFGDISADAFSFAGIGNKPLGVNSQTRQVNINCSNITAQAPLTLRIEAETAQSNMLISNNPHIGFKISDLNNNVLIPNNLNSFILFLLDQNQSASVYFKAWPVSVTGQKPAVGPFSSKAYIRIDFP